MGALTRLCSVCNQEFEPRFGYQMEERVDRDADGQERVSFVHYCSQACLQSSHEAAATCDGCGARFRAELASQVLFVAGRRRHACSPECRMQLLAPTPTTEPAPSVDGVRRLAVFNHKGGTGKTTTAVTLAAGLASLGRRVLLVDTDGQGNVAVSLGLTATRSLYHVLVLGLDFRQAVLPARPGLDVLTADETIAAAELYLAGRRQRHEVLATRLSAALDAYDHVIVDCSPSLSLMNQNALVMAGSVLCPVACDYLSLVGVRQVLRTIQQVNRLLGHPLQLWGVLPTQYDARACICREALATLREHFGDRCLGPVRASIKVKEAPSVGKTLLEYAPGSTAALDYLEAVDRIVDDGCATAALGRLAAAGGEG